MTEEDRREPVMQEILRGISKQDERRNLQVLGQRGRVLRLACAPTIREMQLNAV